jgi:hypothetical protein
MSAVFSSANPLDDSSEFTANTVTLSGYSKSFGNAPRAMSSGYERPSCESRSVVPTNLRNLGERSMHADA